MRPGEVSSVTVDKFSTIWGMRACFGCSGALVYCCSGSLLASLVSYKAASLRKPPPVLFSLSKPRKPP